jgi:hypothetical protein
VRERRGPPRLGATDLERHDRLADRAGALGEGQEALRVADRFQEEADHARVVVGDQVLQHVGRGDHGLVAHRRQQADPDAVRAGEAEHVAGQRPALEHDADRAAAQRRHDVQPERGHGGRRVDEAEAVGAEQGQVEVDRAVDEPPFQLAPRPATAVAVAGGEHHDVADARGRSVLQHALHGAGGGEHVGQVDRLVQRPQARHRRPSEDLRSHRVDHPQVPGEPRGGQALHDEAGPSRPVRRADQREASWREERPEPVRCGQAADAVAALVLVVRVQHNDVPGLRHSGPPTRPRRGDRLRTSILESDSSIRAHAPSAVNA